MENVKSSKKGIEIITLIIIVIIFLMYSFNIGGYVVYITNNYSLFHLFTLIGMILKLCLIIAAICSIYYLYDGKVQKKSLCDNTGAKISLNIFLIIYLFKLLPNIVLKLIYLYVIGASFSILGFIIQAIVICLIVYMVGILFYKINTKDNKTGIKYKVFLWGLFTMFLIVKLICILLKIQVPVDFSLETIIILLAINLIVIDSFIGYIFIFIFETFAILTIFIGFSQDILYSSQITFNVVALSYLLYKLASLIFAIYVVVLMLTFITTRVNNMIIGNKRIG